MGESTTHTYYVEMILQWVDDKFRNSEDKCVYYDLPNSKPQDRPKAISGFIPDVHVKYLDSSLTIIGEAKTLNDLENRHCYAQLEAYLKYCASNKPSLLVIAVPWSLVCSAYSLIKQLKRVSNTDSVEVIFIEELPELYIE